MTNPIGVAFLVSFLAVCLLLGLEMASLVKRFFRQPPMPVLQDAVQMRPAVDPYRSPAQLDRDPPLTPVLSPAPLPSPPARARTTEASVSPPPPAQPPRAEPSLPHFQGTISMTLPIQLWSCPVCGTQSRGQLKMWSCCHHTRHNAEHTPPSCLTLGSAHHLHVQCQRCGQASAYQAEGQQYVLVNSRGKESSR